MLTDRRFDPQGYAEIELAKLTAAVDEFMARKISDAVFMGSLFSLGFRGNALRTEFSFRWDERYLQEKASKKRSA